MRRTLSVGVFLAGVAVMVYPHLSVWRLKHEVLDLVPVPPGADVVVEGTEDRPLFATDFVLAYRGIASSVEETEMLLLASGFQPGSRTIEGRETLVAPCCGQYDGVVVAVFESRPGLTGLRISVQDDDITTTWILMTVTGAALMAAAAYGARRRRSDSTTASGPDETALAAV